MTDDDGFLREVTEDVQRDRMVAFFQKYGRLLISCAVVIVLALAGYTYWSYTKTAQAQDFGAELARIQNLEDGAEQQEAYATLAKEYSDEKRAILAFIHAGASGDVVRPKTDDMLYQDAAILSEIYAQIDEMPTQQAIDALQPLMQEDRPFRLAAMELLASVHLRENATDKAGELYKKIAINPQSPPGMRARATYMQQIYPAPNEGDE